MARCGAALTLPAGAGETCVWPGVTCHNGSFGLNLTQVGLAGELGTGLYLGPCLPGQHVHQCTFWHAGTVSPAWQQLGPSAPVVDLSGNGNLTGPLPASLAGWEVQVLLLNGTGVSGLQDGELLAAHACAGQHRLHAAQRVPTTCVVCRPAGTRGVA